MLPLSIAWEILPWMEFWCKKWSRARGAGDRHDPGCPVWPLCDVWLGGNFYRSPERRFLPHCPLEKRDALEMAQEIKGASVLGRSRHAPVDMDLLVSMLINAGRLV